MKKLVPIFLVFLLLFNVLGFYGLYVGLRYQTNRDLVQLLDGEEYLEEETVTLKVPLVLPYRIDLEEYQRVSGQIEHEGEFYQLVKQKLENDTLYIVCYKDKSRKRMQQVLTDYVKTFTDNPIDTKHQSKAFSGFAKDFLPVQISVQSLEQGWYLSIRFNNFLESEYGNLISISSPPPKAFS